MNKYGSWPDLINKYGSWTDLINTSKYNLLAENQITEISNEKVLQKMKNKLSNDIDKSVVDSIYNSMTADTTDVNATTSILVITERIIKLEALVDRLITQLAPEMKV